MPTDCISFKNTGYFSKLICDYLAENEQLKPFYGKFPKLENFRLQIDEKQSTFSDQSRMTLVSSLRNQYKNVDTSGKTEANITSLLQSNTFTVTTGHQLNLFTGPLYFFYKIVSTINLCKALKGEYPNQNFVPIYWMASEDHDFDEINYFNYKGKKVRWNRSASGAVGELDLNGLDDVFKVFATQLDVSTNAKHLKQLFKNAYLEHKTLTEAMHFLVNKLFGEYGLVILDGNDKDLKRLFIPRLKDDLVNQTAFEKVSLANKVIAELDGDYKIQVNPREINLFYLNENLRERIVFEENKYRVLNTDISWSQNEILDHLDKEPERFSPNVILRPLYQEVILPNLCYIGGGGELAYWLQLKSNFEAQKVPFPILLLRNSVLLITKKQREKLKRLNVSVSDLFLNQTALKTKVTKLVSEIDIDFTPQKELLKKQFKGMYDLAEKTDKSFIGAVAAQEKKQLKGLENLEKRLLKAQKKKFNNVIDRVVELQNELFPNQSLQERNMNFSEFYLEYGEQFIPELIKNLKPLQGEFIVQEI